MDDWEIQMSAADLLRKHYLDPESAKQSPDNLSACICGQWSEGSMEPGWDDHLVEVLWDAGWRPAEAPELTTLRLGRSRTLTGEIVMLDATNGADDERAALLPADQVRVTLLVTLNLRKDGQ